MSNVGMKLGTREGIRTMSAPDTLRDVRELLEGGWQIRWDGRTGGHYPPNYRLVEFENTARYDSYIPVRQLHFLTEDFEEVEERRERSDGDDAQSDSEG